MKVDITKVTLRHNRHQTMVETLHTPNWIERNILRLKPKNEYFVGHKSTWFIFPGMKPITNKADLKELESIELKFAYMEVQSTGRDVNAELEKRAKSRAERKKRNRQNR